MALKLDLCRISRTREIPWADSVTKVREGQAMVRGYESGSEVSQPGASGADGFAGVALSTETEITRWPRVERLTLSGTAGAQTAALSKVPADRTNRLAIFNAAGTAVTVSTDGTPGSGEIDVSATGSIITGASVTAGVYTFAYEYAPSAVEARVLQGDPEPGTHVTREYGSTTVIIAGDVYTTEWDVGADWDNTNAAFGVLLASDGRFTIGTSASAIANVAVIQYPTAESEFLGLRFAL